MMLPRHSRPTHAIIEGQGHLVRLSCKGAAQVGGGKRKNVSTFSAASRKRLLEKLARLDPAKSEFPPSFIALTYPKQFPDPMTAKRHLQTFWKRLRRVCPEGSAVWRLEFQERGAPHFHLIYFGPFIGKYLLQKWWGEVIGFDRPFTRIEALRNWRQTLAYAAKYLAKVPERPTECAVAGGTAEGGAGAARDSGFNYVTYLTGDDEGLGRVWGVFDRKNLPWGERQEVELAVGRGRWLHRLKRAMRHEWKGVNRREFDGATLFRENPEPWLRLAVIEQGEERLRLRAVARRRAEPPASPVQIGDEVAREAVRRRRERRTCQGE